MQPLRGLAKIALLLLAVQGSPAAEIPSTAEAATVCQDVQSIDPDAAFNTLAVVQQTIGGLGFRLNKAKSGWIISKAQFQTVAANVSLVLPPKNGSVALLPGDYPHWQYRATPGYEGTDTLLFAVSFNERRVVLRYNLLVAQVVNERKDGHQDCDFVSFK